MHPIVVDRDALRELIDCAATAATLCAITVHTRAGIDPVETQQLVVRLRAAITAVTAPLEPPAPLVREALEVVADPAPEAWAADTRPEVRKDS